MGDGQYTDLYRSFVGFVRFCYSYIIDFLIIFEIIHVIYFDDITCYINRHGSFKEFGTRHR